jgi:hypothetical protein
MNEKSGSGRCREPELMSRLQAIEDYLWPNGFTRDVWMIVDCARDQQRIFRFLLSCHLEYSCLYSGYLPPVLETAAPYLVQLEHDNAETRRLIELSWGNSWGVFLRSGTNLNKLRKHLRGFLMVRDPLGRRMTFRYYDPRVLRVYLPTCNGEELRTVSGPIECFWTEAEKDSDRMLEFRFEGGRLARKHLSLRDPRPPDARPYAV